MLRTFLPLKLRKEVKSNKNLLFSMFESCYNVRAVVQLYKAQIPNRWETMNFNPVQHSRPLKYQHQKSQNHFARDSACCRLMHEDVVRRNSCLFRGHTVQDECAT